MIPTLEQFEAMHDGARQEHNRRTTALRKALDAFGEACAGCWMLEHGGCEQAKCSIWRMWQQHSKVQRMRGKEQLDAWDWYNEAKDTGRLLFIEPDTTTEPTITTQED